MTNQPVARRPARKIDRAKRVNRAPRWTIEMTKMPRWMKYGFIFVSAYLALILLFVIGVVFEIGGRGEDNIFGWLLIFSGYPLVWLLNKIGIKAAITTITSIVMWPIFQTVIVFCIGALYGQLTSIKKTRQKGKADEIGP